jgi:hypothetical protein
MLILLCREVVGFFCGRSLEWPVAIKVGTLAVTSRDQPPALPLAGPLPAGSVAELVNADSWGAVVCVRSVALGVTYGCLAPLELYGASRR